MINKTLYLTSGDYKSFEIVRKIESYRWLSLDDQDCLAVDVDVPVDLAKYGLSNSPIYTLYLVNRFAEQARAFKVLSSFPIYVHVLISKSFTKEKLSSQNDFLNIAWATLFDSLQDAKTR